MDFASRLRAAVSAQELSLEHLARELSSRGAPTSRSSLSGWQSGTSRPERASSLRALAVLEEILGLPAGELRAALPPRTPRARPGATRLQPSEAWENPEAVTRVMARLGVAPSDPTVPQALSQRLHLSLDERGHMRSLTMSTLVKARRKDTRRLVSVSTDDSIHDAPQIVTARGATVGRFRADPANAVSAYELLFHKPLELGELALLEYTEHFPPNVDGTDLTIRMHPGSREVVVSVQFHTAKLPQECVAFLQPRAGRPEQVLEKLSGTVVQFIRLDPAPGIYGVRWTWA